MNTVTIEALLLKQYPPLVTQAQLAEIYGQHVQTIRRLAREGKLPFSDVSITPAEKRYRLTDVIQHITDPPQQVKPLKRRGRPVGSKNRQQGAQS